MSLISNFTSRQFVDIQNKCYKEVCKMFGLGYQMEKFSYQTVTYWIASLGPVKITFFYQRNI